MGARPRRPLASVLLRIYVVTGLWLAWFGLLAVANATGHLAVVNVAVLVGGPLVVVTSVIVLVRSGSKARRR